MILRDPYGDKAMTIESKGSSMRPSNTRCMSPEKEEEKEKMKEMET
jgi:hypothetical protein